MNSEYKVNCYVTARGRLSTGVSKLCKGFSL